MMTWCSAHPWMTFFLALAALDVIGHVGLGMARRNYWKRPDGK